MKNAVWQAGFPALPRQRFFSYRWRVVLFAEAMHAYPVLDYHPKL